MKEVIRNSDIILFRCTSISDCGKYFVTILYFPCFYAMG